MEAVTGEEQQPETPEIKKQAAANELTIPKHRFDCVNLCLKETKQALRERAEESEKDKIRIAELEAALLDAKVEKALALHRAKNVAAAKALIDFSKLRLEQDGKVPGIEEQIILIKNSQTYLFESQESTAYVLVPVKKGSSLNKSIINYVKKTEKEK